MPVDPLEEARERLEPCPFCGGKAEIVHIEEGENAGGSCVSCTRCLASSNVEFEFKENFVSNWNRRSPPTREGEGWSGRDVAVQLIEKVRDLLTRRSFDLPPSREERESMAESLDMAITALLAAAPPPPEGEVEQQYSSLRSASPRSVLGSAGNLTDGAGETSKGWAGDARWPQPGDRVRFLGENGYDSEREAALKVFAVGEELTVRRCDVGNWDHRVYFEGHDRGWNGVMFARLAPADTGRGEDPNRTNPDPCAEDEA